jgi:hypothetical protein
MRAQDGRQVTRDAGGTGRAKKGKADRRHGEAATEARASIKETPEYFAEYFARPVLRLWRFCGNLRALLPL